MPIVFDNLIHKKEMPVTIGIFINPGHAGEELPADPWRGSNRSFEYDTLSEQYARFLLEEILPEVGKSYNLTDDPAAGRSCGTSSGGICAFTVAWERPDAFRKVLSHVGSFTNIRGGHVYPALDPQDRAAKPIRVFLQDGSNDLDNAARQLAARQPGDGRGAQVPRLRLPVRVRRRRPQRQARRRDPARVAALAVARHAPASYEVGGGLEPASLLRLRGACFSGNAERGRILRNRNGQRKRTTDNEEQTTK